MAHETGHQIERPPDLIGCGCLPDRPGCAAGREIHAAKVEAHREAMVRLEQHIGSGCQDWTWEPYRAAQLAETDAMRAWADHLEPDAVAA